MRCERVWKNSLFFPSERREESLFELNQGQEGFLGGQRDSVHRERNDKNLSFAATCESCLDVCSAEKPRSFERVPS
jgi:hypothetical protein